MAVPLEHLALGIWGVIFGQCGLSPREKKILFHEKKKPKQANFVFTGKKNIGRTSKRWGLGVLSYIFFLLENFLGVSLEILQ